MKDDIDAVMPVLLGGSRTAILSELSLHPQDRLHVRELARVTGRSAGSLHRELRLLAELGLLLRETVGRQVFYRANTLHALHGPLAALLRADGPAAARRRNRQPSGARRSAGGPVPQVSAQRLAALCRKHHIRRLAIFGSAARGEARAGSDVDLLVEFEPGRAPSFWDSPGVEEDLSALFGNRRVDLVPPEVMDNPYRRAAILRDLTVLYEARGS